MCHFPATQVNQESTHWLFTLPQENNRQLIVSYKYNEGHLKRLETRSSICLTGTNLVSKFSQGVLSLQDFICSSHCLAELHSYT